MYRKISTWFGSISFDTRTVILDVSESGSKSSESDVITAEDDVENVACTHLHLAILLKNGKLMIRRIDDFEENPRTFTLKDSGDVTSPEEKFILVATSQECYVVRCLQKASEILKVLEDSKGIEDVGAGGRFLKIQFPWPVKIVEAIAGHDFLIYRDSMGNLFSMGTGTRGELGVGLIRRVDEPVHIEQLAGIRVQKVSCGGWHTIVLTETGDAYTWGWNRHGQLGKNKASTEVYPVLIDPAEEFGVSEEDIDDVTAAEHSSQIVIKTSNSTFMLGANPVPPINDLHLD